MRLLIDPGIRSTDAEPKALTGRPGIEVVTVHYSNYLADPSSVHAPRCDRCNRLLHVHLWQLLDADSVINCAVQP